MRQETPAPKGAGVSLFFHLRCALGGLALEVDVVELIRDLLHKELLQVDVGADLTEEEEELEEDEEPLSAAAIFSSVFVPATPSAVRPFFFWKFMTAASVLEPKWPLMVPL